MHRIQSGVAENLASQHIETIMTNLTSHELELLGLLQEECAEVIQIVSKIRRFGIESYNPYLNEYKSNRTLLEEEMGDVECIAKLLTGRRVADASAISRRSVWKMGKLEEGGVIPKSPSLKEWLSQPVDPEVSTLFVEMEAEEQRERRQRDIIYEIQEVEISQENLAEWEGHERKYLLQKAAAILAQLERLPDEDRSTLKD